MRNIIISTLFLGLTLSASTLYAEAYVHLTITVANNTNQTDYTYFNPLNQAHDPGSLIISANTTRTSSRIYAWGFNQSGTGSGNHEASGCFINAIGNGVSNHRQYSINYEGNWHARGNGVNGNGGQGSSGDIPTITAITPNTSTNSPGYECWKSASAIPNDATLQNIFNGPTHGSPPPPATYPTPTGAIAPMNFGPQFAPIIGGSPTYSYGSDYITIMSLLNFTEYSWTATVTENTYCINPTGIAPACALLTK